MLQVVADTVAAPVEQQVNGVEGMLYMSSQSGNDGSYTLTVTFDIGTNLNTALVMVQNRVQLAMPQLPTEVQLQGITIRKRTSDILQVINFTSPDGRYDSIYLSNYATIHVRDELLRIDGVSDINLFGQRDYSIRAWLDPQKLAARGITGLDVVAAIRAQNIEAAPGRIAQSPGGRVTGFEWPLDTLGRLTDPNEFGNIIIVGGPLLSSPLTAAGSTSTATGGASFTGRPGNQSHPCEPTANGRRPDRGFDCRRGVDRSDNYVSRNNGHDCRRSHHAASELCDSKFKPDVGSQPVWFQFDARFYDARSFNRFGPNGNELREYTAHSGPKQFVRNIHFDIDADNWRYGWADSHERR